MAPSYSLRLRRQERNKQLQELKEHIIDEDRPVTGIKPKVSTVSEYRCSLIYTKQPKVKPKPTGVKEVDALESGKP